MASLHVVDLTNPAENGTTESHNLVRSYVERFARLFEDAAEIKEAVADLKLEAKGNGFSDPKALVELARRSLETPAVRAKREAYREELERLETALGVLADSPLGRAAVDRAGGRGPAQ